MGQEPVVGQADAQAGGQPVEDEADSQGLPGEIAGDKREEGTDVQPRDPEKGGPRDAGRLRPLRGGCSHWDVSSRGKACGAIAAWRRPLKHVSGGRSRSRRGPYRQFQYSEELTEINGKKFIKIKYSINFLLVFIFLSH